MNNRTLSLAIGAALISAVFNATAATAATTPQIRKIAAPAPADVPATRLIVKYRNGAAGTSSKQATLMSAARRAGIAQTSAATLGASVLRRQGTGADVMRLSRRLSRSELDSVLTELRADSAVEYAEEDLMLRPVEDLRMPGTLAAAGEATSQFTPDDPRFATYQWHLHDAEGGINAPAAWELSHGSGVVVAVLDTGILSEHPDLKDNDHVLEGYDFISDAEVSRRGTDDRAAGALDYGDWVEGANLCYTGSPASNSSWHGTHTAGTVGELTNNGVGGAGVAFEAQVLPVRVLGRCGGYTSDIADAITWASGGSVEGVPDNAHPAEVISLSLGGSGTCGTVTQTAIDGAVARGSVVVVAAGNSASDASNFTPASCNNVITVGATRITGGMASYSNYGGAVDLSGPGGGGGQDTGNSGWDGYVFQTGYSGTTTPTSGDYSYAGMAGTSMATPHVAAVAALVQSALAEAGREPLTPAALETLLKQSARAFPVSIPASTPIGAGIVDAKAALDKALEEPCDPATQNCLPAATPLLNKVAVSGLSGSATSESTYSFVAAAGSILNILSYGGSGDVSMYVSFESEPSASAYDAKSTRTGNSETVRFAAPQAGTYYIKLVGATSYSGVSLVARQ